MATNCDSTLQCDLQRVTDLLANHCIPLGTQRTNIIPEPARGLCTPRSQLFGAYTQRGVGTTTATWKKYELVKALHRVASHLRSTEHSGEYTCIQLNKHSGMQIHKDTNNEGLSFIIAFGEYQGGRLWVQDCDGTEAPPNALTDAEKALRGAYHDIREQFYVLDGTQYHAAEESQGTRYSLVFFTPRHLHKLNERIWDDLRTLGFPCQSAEAPAC
jgi:hypothetical protein